MKVKGAGSQIYVTDVFNLWHEGGAGPGNVVGQKWIFAIVQEAGGRLLWNCSPKRRRQINGVTFSTVSSGISPLHGASVKPHPWFPG